MGLTFESQLIDQVLATPEFESLRDSLKFAVTTDGTMRLFDGVTVEVRMRQCAYRALVIGAEWAT